MALPRMRPSFIVEARCRPDDAMACLRERLEVETPPSVEGTFSQRHGVLCMPKPKQHFWSPCLDLTIDDASKDARPVASEAAAAGDRAEAPAGASRTLEPRTRVWGTFSPRPEIWTGFVFAIGTLVILSILSVLYGVAQLMIGEAPWSLVIPLVAAVIGGGLYASALTGQGLSGSEIYAMRAYVDACLHEAEHLARRRPTLPPDASAQL